MTLSKINLDGTLERVPPEDFFMYNEFGFVPQVVSFRDQLLKSAMSAYGISQEQIDKGYHTLAIREPQGGYGRYEVIVYREIGRFYGTFSK